MIFFKKNLNIGNYDFLGVDMHNHILPGIDDGAKDVNASLYLLESLKKLGISKVIPTPHTMHQLYPNNAVTIETAYKSISTTVKTEPDKYPGIIGYSSEYLLDDQFPLLRESKQLLGFAHNHVLIEMSYAAASPILEEEIYQLQLAGYTPILAHPERYNYLHGNFNYYENLVRRGCQFQLNLISLTDYYGKDVQKNALKLLDMQLYHWAGTDAHHEGHIELLNQLLRSKHIHKLRDYEFKNQMI